MKKHVVILSMVLAISLFFGCGNVNKDNDTSSEELKIEEYFPILENVKYVYEGMGNEYASYNVITEYVEGNKVQQRVDNGGTVIARVYEVKDGKITRLLNRGEMYDSENLLSEKDEEEIILMEPLEEGTSWSLEDGSVRQITNISSKVSTTIGEYEAIEVMTERLNSINIDYYAKNVGLVKSVFNSEGFEVSSTLSKIEEIDK